MMALASFKYTIVHKVFKGRSKETIFNSEPEYNLHYLILSSVGKWQTY